MSEKQLKPIRDYIRSRVKDFKESTSGSEPRQINLSEVQAFAFEVIGSPVFDSLKSTLTHLGKAFDELEDSDWHNLYHNEVVTPFFPFSTRDSFPPVHLDTGLEGFLRLFSDYPGIDAENFYTNHEEAIRLTLAGLATHHSRVCNTSTVAGLVSLLPKRSPVEFPYLCSSTVKGLVEVSSFSGAQAVAPIKRVGKVLLASFTEAPGGEPCSLLSKIVSNELSPEEVSLLERFGFHSELRNDIASRSGVSVGLSDQVAQIYCHRGDFDYELVSPLPSVVVLDRLNYESRTRWESLNDRSRYLPRVTREVGGAQPQNAGLFNLSQQGRYQQLYGRLPCVNLDDKSALIARAWSKFWINKPSVETLREIVKTYNASASNQENRRRFEPLSKKLVHQMSSFCLALRDVYRESFDELPEELRKRIQAHPLFGFLQNNDATHAEDFYNQINELISKAHRELMKNPELHQILSDAVKHQVTQLYSKGGAR